MAEENGRPTPYDEKEFNPNIWLKETAEALGVTADRLLVLASQNDPFNRGTSTDWQEAKWFKDVYERFGYKGIHLRRLHYRIANSGEAVLLWDGKTRYKNEKPFWKKLVKAFAPARTLGLVDAYDFTENRVQNPRHEGMSVYSLAKPEFDIEQPSLWSLPSAPGADLMPSITDVHRDPFLRDPEVEVYGYEYGPGMQPHLVEVWAEKSGDDATIRSVARLYGVNYQPGIGYSSITNIKGMLRRVAEHEKTAVILYVSDYDDAGRNMPVQVGRHSQFACWELEELAEEIAPEIVVDNVALTAEQVEELGIPPTPDTNKREIDALEALHPGKLREFLIERIEELQDPGLEDRVAQAEEDARQAVKDELDPIVAEYEEKIVEVREQAEEIVNRYQRYYEILGEKMAQRYERLSQRFERHIEELRDDHDKLKEELQEAIEEIDVDLPEVPKPEVELPQRRWLFDSRRDFLDQTVRFRRAQGKE